MCLRSASFGPVAAPHSKVCAYPCRAGPARGISARSPPAFLLPCSEPSHDDRPLCSPHILYPPCTDWDGLCRYTPVDQDAGYKIVSSSSLASTRNYCSPCCLAIKDLQGCESLQKERNSKSNTFCCVADSVRCSSSVTVRASPFRSCSYATPKRY